ncbi:TolB family protein [Candidatus Poribacteria bacterium]
MRRVIGLSLCVFLIVGSAFAGALRRGKVAFWSYDTDNFPYRMWVYVMNADGSDVTKLLARYFEEGGKGFGVNGAVSLSPDCRRAAFYLQTWNGNFLASNDIAVIDLDGHEIVNLTDSKLLSCGGPRWSPSGEQIVFSGRSELPRKLCIMNSDGTNIRVIGEGWGPDWSRNGRKIAFVRDRVDIYTMDADGDNVKKIARSPKASVSSPRWSPDGRKILFSTSANNDIGRIYIMDSDGDSLKLIKENAYDACWSPDGKKIAFSRADNEDSFWHGGHIWLMNPDGSGLERLTDNERGEFDFDWRDPAFIGIDLSLDAAKVTWGEVKTQIESDD